MNILVRMFVLVVMSWACATPCLASDGGASPRILIVGDSWAASIATENRDGVPVPGVFDAVLTENGLGDVRTRGARTAWGGRKASDWAKAKHLEEIREELTAYPSIDAVHLIIGGNDFLVEVFQRGLAAKSEEERESIFAGIVTDVRVIVKSCLAVRDEIRVVIADYDYLDLQPMKKMLKADTGEADNGTLNTWLRELGMMKKVLALEIDRCYYVDNWGTLQKEFGEAEGEPELTMPEGVSPDGIHPNEAGHKALLQNALAATYLDWYGDEGRER